MRNIYTLLIVLLTACGIFSCKKSDNTMKGNAINGKWLVYQQHSRVYDIVTTDLLKDTTIVISTKSPLALYEIYNSDGTAYITTMPYKKAGATVATTDTTTYLHYSVVGSSLILKQNNGGTETRSILSLTGTNMELERSYTSAPNPTWGLDINTTYKYIDDVYYTKQ